MWRPGSGLQERLAFQLKHEVSRKHEIPKGPGPSLAASPSLSVTAQSSCLMAPGQVLHRVSPEKWHLPQGFVGENRGGRRQDPGCFQEKDTEQLLEHLGTLSSVAGAVPGLWGSLHISWVALDKSFCLSEPQYSHL